MDGVGFGLSHFNALGEHITHEKGKPECRINSEGELPGIGKFSGIRELSELAVNSGRVYECVSRRVVEIAVGKRILNSEIEVYQEWISELTQTLKSTEDFKALLKKVALSPEFSQRRSSNE